MTLIHSLYNINSWFIYKTTQIRKNIGQKKESRSGLLVSLQHVAIIWNNEIRLFYGPSEWLKMN